MNTFVNSILELLLSWIRGIFSDIWAMLTGDSGSFFAWLGKHWLSLVCVLIIGGVTIDWVIYILRWHPQRVWRSKFNRLFRRQTEEETAFADGYLAGIESFELDSDPVISEYINASPKLEQFDAGIEMNTPSLPAETPPLAENQYIRRRRSDRHVRRGPRRRFISLKLPSLEENETPYTAYPAPPVRAREAFHDAVYPSDNQPVWPQDNNANT